MFKYVIKSHLTNQPAIATSEMNYFGYVNKHTCDLYLRVALRRYKEFKPQWTVDEAYVVELPDEGELCSL